LSWRIRIGEEVNGMGKSWKTVKELSRNEVRWRNLREALCSVKELQESSSCLSTPSLPTVTL
jgi:hypothetical protein